MKLYMLKEDDLYTLKSNLKQIKDKFSDKDSKWVEDYFESSPFIETKFNVNDFTLDMSQENPFLTEFENVKRLYGNLDMLSESQASDERLWAGLCLREFYHYVQYRWDIKDSYSEKKVEDHFFFGYGPKRSLTRNALSRLWWIGRLTYDDSRRDPYELTKFVCENSNYILHILERNTSNNRQLTKTFISALIEARKTGVEVNQNLVAELSKYINLLGGTYILDCLPSKNLYERILSKALTINSVE